MRNSGAMDLSRDDRRLLENLRQRFLTASPQGPYWTSGRELELYHATFAQRIAWKWRAVLDELDDCGWSIPTGVVVDFGCGSGVAAETVLAHYGWSHITDLILIDHASCALAYARKRLGERFPGIPIHAHTAWEIPQGCTVLLSHVLTELDSTAIAQLAIVLRAAQAIVIVEPGTRQAASRVVTLRELLRSDFSIVAPCPHQSECGMIHPQNWRHWCHFHLEPPSEAFTEREWSRFAQLFGIDITALPVSFLVLDRQWQQTSCGKKRLIGAPDVTNEDAAIVLCSEDGISERVIRKQEDRRRYRQLRKRPPRWLE